MVSAKHLVFFWEQKRCFLDLKFSAPNFKLDFEDIHFWTLLNIAIAIKNNRTKFFFYIFKITYSCLNLVKARVSPLNTDFKGVVSRPHCKELQKTAKSGIFLNKQPRWTTSKQCSKGSFRLLQGNYMNNNIYSLEEKI